MKCHLWNDKDFKTVVECYAILHNLIAEKREYRRKMRFWMDEDYDDQCDKMDLSEKIMLQCRYEQSAIWRRLFDGLENQLDHRKLQEDLLEYIYIEKLWWRRMTATGNSYSTSRFFQHHCLVVSTRSTALKMKLWLCLTEKPKANSGSCHGDSARWSLQQSLQPSLTGKITRTWASVASLRMATHCHSVVTWRRKVTWYWND